MKIISPFGPKLGKIKIPKKIISLLNQEVDKIIKNKKETKQKDYSKKVVGQVYQEIQISKKFIDKKFSFYVAVNQLGLMGCDRKNWNNKKIDKNTFFCSDKKSVKL